MGKLLSIATVAAITLLLGVLGLVVYRLSELALAAPASPERRLSQVVERPRETTTREASLDPAVDEPGAPGEMPAVPEERRKELQGIAKQRVRDQMERINQRNRERFEKQPPPANAQPAPPPGQNR